MPKVMSTIAFPFLHKNRAPLSIWMIRMKVKSETERMSDREVSDIREWVWAIAENEWYQYGDSR